MNARLSLLVAGLVVAACASSSARVVKTFEVADPTGVPFTRILVVGAHKDRSVRRQFEETIVESLRAHRVDAVLSIQAMPAGEGLSEATVAAAAQDARADAVLVTRLLDVHWSAEFDEGRTTTEAQRKEGGNLLDFFRYDYVEYQDPMSVSAVRTVVVESNLYRVADRTRIWSVESTAVEKENAMAVIESITAATTSQLRRDGLIP